MRISDWSSDVCSSDLPDRASSPYGEAAVKVARIAFAAMIAVTTPCALAQARADARTGYWWYQAPPAPVEEPDDPDAVVKPVDRKRDVEGQSVSVRVDLGGRRINKKKQNIKNPI